MSICDLSSEQILSIIDLAVYLKDPLNTINSKKQLEGKILGMVFQKPSTRTRISFETAILQLGGNAINLSFNDLQLSRGESIEDTARTFSLYLDCLVARVFSHSDIELLSQYSDIPVINGLSDLFHPCQILADLLTIMEYKKRLEGITLAFVGDGNNICNDLLLGCSKLGINIKISTPPGFEPLKIVIDVAKKDSAKNNSYVLVSNDPSEVVKDADVVVTDTFISIGKESEKQHRDNIFLPEYQVNASLVKNAKDDYIFMHCLPAKRGMEVTGEIIDGPHSVVWSEAKNRLHVQKALLIKLLDKDFVD
ncbi:MAG TPA: ornithine carbamoyltransferase [Candidatus Nitrosocosmicus sp.]